MITKKNIYQFLPAIALVISSLFFACQKDNSAASTIDIGYGYAPDKIGFYIVYDCDSIVYNSFTKKIDTFKFQTKEVIESNYTDNADRPTQRIERYRKNYSKTIPYSAMAWTLKDVWAANKTNKSFERVEENERFVKLTFPVDKNNTWNGNAFNTMGEWNYKYVDAHVKRTLAGTNFDSTTQVVQINKETLIDKKYYVEIYAKNVGMIYKEIVDVKSDSITSKPLLQRVSSGIINYKAIVNSYGNN